MDSFFTAFNSVVGLGSIIVIPVALTILGMLLKIRISSTLRSAFSVGFSMYILILLMGKFGAMLNEFGRLIVSAGGYTAQISDVTRGAALLAESNSRAGIYIFALAIVINALMLVLGVCRTINLDFWSLWIASFTALFVETLTGSFAYGMIAACSVVIVSVIAADFTHKQVEKYCYLPGVSCAEPIAVSYSLIGKGVCSLCDMIPTKGRKDITLGFINRKTNGLLNPSTITAIFSAVMLMIYGHSVVASLQFGLYIGALVFIIPKVMYVLGENMTPVAKELQNYSVKVLKGRGNVNIAMPSVAAQGNTIALVMCVIMVPVTIWLSAVLPGNLYMPTLNFEMLPYIFVLVCIVCKRGLIRAFISCTVSVIVMLYSATYASGLFTQLLATLNIAGETAGIKANPVLNPLTVFLTWLASYGPAGIVAITGLTLLVVFLNYNRLTGRVKLYKPKQKKLRTAGIDELIAQREQYEEIMETAVSKKRMRLRHSIIEDKMRENAESAKENSENSVQTTLKL